MLWGTCKIGEMHLAEEKVTWCVYDWRKILEIVEDDTIEEHLITILVINIAMSRCKTLYQSLPSTMRCS